MLHCRESYKCLARLIFGKILMCMCSLFIRPLLLLVSETPGNKVSLIKHTVQIHAHKGFHGSHFAHHELSKLHGESRGRAQTLVLQKHRSLPLEFK